MQRHDPVRNPPALAVGRFKTVLIPTDHDTSNIWFGVTAENQEMADERIPVLIQIPSKTRFVSVEPMLNKVDLYQYLHRLSWVICGSETGPHARIPDLNWIRKLRDQCIEEKVAFFLKQVDSKRHKVLDGYVHDEFPYVIKGDEP
jgi:protein gp37